FHPLFSQYSGLFLLSIAILNFTGIALLMFIILKAIVMLWISPSTLPQWLTELSDYRFFKPYQGSILASAIFLPLIPFGLVLFIDHTIVYSDYGGSLVRATLKSGLLAIITFYCGMQILNKKTLFENYPDPNSSLKQILHGIYQKIRLDYSLKEVPQSFIRHFGLVLLIIGVITPFFIFSIDLTVSASVVLFFSGQSDVELTLAQNTFLSFTQIITVTFIPVLWFFGYQRTDTEFFYLFKHTNGQWYFLPDTFMAHPGDWLHGLLTVGSWLLFIFLYFYAIYEYLHNREIISGVSVIGVIVTEILWLLFTLGLGSIPAEGEAPPSPLNQTVFQFVEMDFTLNSFLFLPVGLILFLLAAIILLISGIRQRRREKHVNEILLDNQNHSKDPHTSSRIMDDEETKYSEKL
ncbi:MAG: hypothetical protein JSV04_02130, partial [Candidatus Heimdallarchaeota archaeon]